jgi:hypothetical protein
MRAKFLVLITEGIIFVRAPLSAWGLTDLRGFLGTAKKTEFCAIYLLAGTTI